MGNPSTTMFTGMSGRIAAAAVRAFATRSGPTAIRMGAAGTLAATTALWSTSNMAECQQKTPYTGVPGTNKERTFIAVKPDGVQRAIVSDIIARFEKRGYKLVAMKMVWPTEKMAAEHYADLSTKKFFPGLIKFFSSGPIVAMVWEGPSVISQGRVMLGATNPQDAPTGSIRGDLCTVVGRNICHGSDGPDSAKHEIGYWFKAEEVSDWGRDADKWLLE